MFSVRSSTLPPVSFPSSASHQPSFDHSLSQSQALQAGSNIAQTSHVSSLGNPAIYPEKRAFLLAYANLSQDISGYISSPKEIPSPAQFETYKKNNASFIEHGRNYLIFLTNQVGNNIEHNKNLLENLNKLSLPEEIQGNLTRKHQENIQQSENLYNKLIVSLNNGNGSHQNPQSLSQTTQPHYNNFIVQFTGNSPHNAFAITRMEKLVKDKLTIINTEQKTLDLLKKTDEIYAKEAPFNTSGQNKDDVFSSSQQDVDFPYSEFLLPDSAAVLNSFFA